LSGYEAKANAMARWFSILHQKSGEMPQYYSWFNREAQFRRFVQALIDAGIPAEELYRIDWEDEERTLEAACIADLLDD